MDEVERWSVEVFLNALATAPRATAVHLPIPADPWLSGVAFHAQALVGDRLTPSVRVRIR